MNYFDPVILADSDRFPVASSNDVAVYFDRYSLLWQRKQFQQCFQIDATRNFSGLAVNKNLHMLPDDPIFAHLGNEIQIDGLSTVGNGAAYLDLFAHTHRPHDDRCPTRGESRKLDVDPREAVLVGT